MTRKEYYTTLNNNTETMRWIIHELIHYAFVPYNPEEDTWADGVEGYALISIRTGHEIHLEKDQLKTFLGGVGLGAGITDGTIL
jgi:hypothetical protein